MATKEEQMLKETRFMLDQLKQSSTYQDYIKIRTVLDIGRNTDIIINKLIEKHNLLIDRIQRPARPMPSRVVPKPPKEQYEEPTEEREEELNKKVGDSETDLLDDLDKELDLPGDISELEE